MGRKVSKGRERIAPEPITREDVFPEWIGEEIPDTREENPLTGPWAG